METWCESEKYNATAGKMDGRTHSLDGLPQQLDQQQVLAFLQEKYEPVNAKWTTERCAVCRWVED